MKKTNIIVSIIVAIVCVVAGVFIFMPNNNTAFEEYYKEIKAIEEYQDHSDYIDISATRNEDGKVDLILSNPKDVLTDFKILVIPENASLRFSKTFVSAGFFEGNSITLAPVEQGEESISYPGIASVINTKDDELLIYLEFNVYSSNLKKVEYLKIEVED